MDTSPDPQVSKSNSSSNTDTRAKPLASGSLANQLIDMAKQAYSNKQLKRGANEVIKALNKNKAAFVVLAADCDPLEIVLPIPHLCEDKDVPYIFVPSKAKMGRACGVSRPCIAFAVLENRNSSLTDQIDALKIKIEAAMT